MVLTPRQAELSDGPFNAGERLTASWEAASALVLDNDQAPQAN
jgi:spermidine/putrescine transport system ATP-binding protein